jgi:hypothetical protein
MEEHTGAHTYTDKIQIFFKMLFRKKKKHVLSIKITLKYIQTKNHRHIYL